MAEKRRIFISSPSDVADERRRAALVIKRLNREFARFFDLEAVLWEREPMRASGHFQDIIVPPSATDIVVVILCARLGIPLPERTAVRQYCGLDGRSPVTGTEWEFEDALRANRECGVPELLVYRKPAAAAAVTIQADRLDEAKAQLLALEAFWRRHFVDERGGFKAAFNQFETLDAFEEQLEQHLRQLLRARLPRPEAGSKPADTEIAWHQGSPFRGLQVFEAAHEKIFFGRARAEQAVIEALVRQASIGTAFVLVLGASGSGKSSLVRAGVVPQLMSPGVVTGVEVWRSCVFKPSEATGDLVAALAQALIGQNKALPELPAAGIDLSDVITQLRAAAMLPFKMGLRQAALAMPRPAGAPVPAARLVLVIDQLEELFTLGEITTEQRANFVALLATLAKSGVVWVLATMRSDLYHRCAELPELVDLAAGEGQYHLTMPRPAELDQMIRLPAAAAGIGFEIHPDTRIALNAVLLEAAARDPTALPLLEFTLNELYHQDIEARHGPLLTYESYTALDGLEGAIAARADTVCRGLPPAQAAELPSLLSALVTVGEDSDLATARVMPHADLATTPVRTALLDILVSERLLVANDDRMGPVIRLTHEALLSHWPLLKKLVDRDLDFLRVRTRLQADRARWQAEGHSQDLLLPAGKRLEEAKEVLKARRDEIDAATAAFIEGSIERERRLRQRSLRRTRAAAAIMAALAVIAGGFGWYSYEQRQQAERNFDNAIDAADKLGTEVARRLRPLAGIKGNSADRVRDMLTKAEEIFAKLIAEAQYLPDPKHRQEVQDRQARMRLEFAETYAALGDTEKQLNQAQEANRIMQGLVAQDSGNATWQQNLANTSCSLGQAMQARGDLNGALAAYRHGQSLLERLIDQDPNNIIWQGSLMACLSHLPIVLSRQGDQEGELATWYYFRRIAERLHSRKLDDVKMQEAIKEALSSADSGIKATLSQSDPARRLILLREQQAEDTRLREQDPGNSEITAMLAFTTIAIGDGLWLQRDLQEAMAAYDSAQTLLTPLINQDPHNTQWQYLLAQCYQGKGQLLKAENNLDAAMTFYDLAYKTLTPLLTKDPANVEWRSGLALNYFGVGRTKMALGNTADALSDFREASHILEDLVFQSRHNLYLIGYLMPIHKLIGAILLGQGDYNGALAVYEKSRKISEELAETNPENTQVRSWGASSVEEIGQLKGRQGDHAAELEALRIARSIWEELAAKNPDDIDFRYSLVCNYNATGDTLRAQGHFDEAQAMYIGIQKQIDELTRKDAAGSYINPSSRVLLNVQLLKSYLGSGEALEAQANLEGALRAYGVVKGMAGDLIKQGQANEVWPYLKISYLMIGTVLWKQSNRGQTLEECREWVAFVKDHNADINNSQSELVTALWTLAWYYIKNGKFAEAQATAMEARTLDDRNNWILVLLSITEMYRGDMRVATDMHMQHRNEMVILPGGKQKKWHELVGEYFGELKRDGLERPEMVDIEHMLAKKE